MSDLGAGNVPSSSDPQIWAPLGDLGGFTGSGVSPFTNLRAGLIPIVLGLTVSVDGPDTFLIRIKKTISGNFVWEVHDSIANAGSFVVPCPIALAEGDQLSIEWALPSSMGYVVSTGIWVPARSAFY